MASTQSKLELPEPQGIKVLERDSTSIYLRWAILSSHGLNKQQLTDLKFEVRTTDNKLKADCVDNSPSNEYKARLCGLTANKKYRFQVRSKLQLKSNDEIITSTWSNRIEVNTRPKMDHFVVISNEKELELESLKHRLKMYMNDNKKLQLQIEQLQSQLNENPKQAQPGHWTWDDKKIVNWIMRIQDGAFKQYKKELTKALKDEGITGRDLVMVDESNLKEWGITNFNLRKVLIHYIETLTEHDNKPQIAYDPSLTKQLTTAQSQQDAETDEQNESKDKESEKKENKQQEQEQDENNNEAKDKDNEEKTETQPELPSRTADISASVQALLDTSSEVKKVWKYKEGMLSVLVVGAVNVDNLDMDNWDKESASASDPYVELDLKGNYKKEKTKSIENCEHPKWNEKFQLFVDDPRNDVLKCMVYDHDKWTMDQKIGAVEIPIITILGANGYMRKEFDVIGSKTGCKLELELKYWESLR